MKNTSRILVASIAAAFAQQSALALQLQLLDTTSIASGTQVLGTTLGGLSGIDYRASDNTYFAISDDRSQANPARFYNLSLDYNDAGFVGLGYTFNTVTTMLRPDTTAFPALSVDPEAIRYNAATGNLHWTSEGDANASINPHVRTMTTSGAYVGDFAVPAHYNSTGVAGVTGIRQNLAFESLALSPDGTRLFTGTENALKQDGPAADVSLGSPSRIILWNTAGTLLSEFVYLTDPVEVAPTPGQFATNGLVEFLAIDNDTLLAVERSFSVGAPGRGNNIDLYLVELAGATDVKAFNDLDNAGAYTAVSKTFIADLGADFGLDPDNIEGITWGHDLANGNRTLVLVSDDNFSATQETQFVILEVVPEPTSAALLALGALALTARRRNK